MNVVIGVVSPAEAWVLPRPLRRRAPAGVPRAYLHRRLGSRGAEAACCRRADVAFAAFLDRDLVPSLTDLRWVQAPAAGVGHLLSDELVASPIVLTSARGVRARAIAEHVMAMIIALSRQLPLVLRRQAEHRWALDEIESAGTVRTLPGGGSRLWAWDRSASRLRGWRPRSDCGSPPCASTRVRPCRTMSASMKSWPWTGCSSS